VPTPGYGRQALQAWSAPARVSKTTRQPGPDASRAYPERRFVRERGKVRDGVNVVTSVNVSTSRSLDLRVHVRLNQHQRPPHVESRKRPATSNPGYGPSRRMPKTSLHAQSLKGISTIAWGCRSAAPATPGSRSPISTQLCRSCLRGISVGGESRERRGTYDRRDATMCVSCHACGGLNVDGDNNPPPTRPVANSFRVES